MKWILVSSYDIFRFLQVYFCKFRKQQISKANRILSSISCLANNAGKGHNFQSNFIIFKETFANFTKKKIQLDAVRLAFYIQTHFASNNPLNVCLNIENGFQNNNKKINKKVYKR